VPALIRKALMEKPNPPQVRPPFLNRNSPEKLAASRYQQTHTTRVRLAVKFFRATTSEELKTMSIFAITFRIHDDAGYQDRYQTVVDAIKTFAAQGKKYWDEPTSFFLIDSSKNSEGIAAEIDRNSDFASSKDLLLVTNLSQKGFKAIGNVRDDDLYELMKKR
jgi:hypothetical protein